MGIVVHTFNPTTPEAEAGEKFKGNLVYIASSMIGRVTQREAVSINKQQREDGVDRCSPLLLSRKS